MNKQTYSHAYNQSKRELKDAIRKFELENPEKFAELQARALRELNEPTPRIVTRYAPLRKFNIDEFTHQHHTQHSFIHTKDCFGDVHLYFESLDGETAEEVLTRLHPKFVERSEEITDVKRCVCPLCTHN